MSSESGSESTGDELPIGLYASSCSGSAFLPFLNRDLKNPSFFGFLSSFGLYGSISGVVDISSFKESSKSSSLSRRVYPNPFLILSRFISPNKAISDAFVFLSIKSVAIKGDRKILLNISANGSELETSKTEVEGWFVAI